MKCKQCNGEPSFVYIGASRTTRVHGMCFFDEDGREHSHDPNVTTTQYQCSNGHRFSESRRVPCWCGWPEVKP